MNQPVTQQIGQYKTYACTEQHERDQTVLRFNWLKFVPRFADISRPLTTLTKKDTKFEWTSACQKSFELLKEALCGEPVLKYADTSKPYTLYTDASKFG